jgi:hypothetical protein
VLVLAQEETQTAIVSTDTTILDDQTVRRIRHEVHAVTGIPPLQITVAAIQTHTGAATQTCFGWGDRDASYIDEILVPQTVEAARRAQREMRPVRVGIGTTHSRVGVNRREIRPDHTVALGTNPWGPFDPTMTVLRFEASDGPLAILIHYGAHPTAIGHEAIISRDWPGVMIDHVEHLIGAPAFFINGAVGDVGPRLSSGRTTGDGIPGAREVGFRAGSDAVRALTAIKEFRHVDLHLHEGEIMLPYRPLPSLDEAQRQLRAAESGKNEWGAPQCDYLHWRSVVEAHQDRPATGKRYQQTITRLGPVVLVPFPGEPFAEIVLRLRHYSPFPYTLCASTTNGSNGYLVTREALHRGGYEVWVGKAFGPYLLTETIDDVLVEANLAMLQEMAADRPIV